MTNSTTQLCTVLQNFPEFSRSFSDHKIQVLYLPIQVLFFCGSELKMTRVTNSLREMGFDLDSVQSVPVLAPKASQAELEELLQRMEEKCPGVDFGSKSVVARAAFLSRLPDQRRRLQTNLRKWERREHDCLALKPYDEMFTRIYNEIKVSLSLSLCVVVVFNIYCNVCLCRSTRRWRRTPPHRAPVSVLPAPTPTTARAACRPRFLMRAVWAACQRACLPPASRGSLHWKGTTWRSS